MIDGTQDNASKKLPIDGNGGRVSRRRYFSSTEGPFQSANNIYLFSGVADRTQIIDAVTHRLRKFPEPVVVSGESGSGKTMMSLVLSHRLQHNFKIIHFEHRNCDYDRLLRHLLIELTPDLTHVGSSDSVVVHRKIQSGEDLQVPVSDSVSDSNSLPVNTLISRLQGGSLKSKPALLIVDSKKIDADALELINQLCAVTNAHGAPLSAVLFLSQEFVDTDNLTQQKQSRPVTADPDVLKDEDIDFGIASMPVSHYNLRRLNLAETTEYLNHHMLLFDFNKRDLFTREMSYFIADRSEGNCSAINTLARNAFLLAHLEGADQINMSHLLVAGLPERKVQPDGFLKSTFKKYKRAISMCGVFICSSALLLISLVAILNFLN